MSGTSASQSQVIPAQLSSLAIYNPSLGNTEETLAHQIVFYYSEATRSRKAQRSGSDDVLKMAHEEENRRLRQIGLAQGMIDFAKNFSDGKPVDSIETEKSRIVLHELEAGWWILAAIGLTRLPTSQLTPSKPQQDSKSNRMTEYSAREVSPPELILQQLLQAHKIFLLHHAESLNDLWIRLPRDKFCSILERFWTRFIWNWDILLNGNPSADIFSGLKLAAGGELGIGVGEEEWGSGEREVLEGFVTRTDGLIDLVVSRFGEEPPKGELEKGSKFDAKENDPTRNAQQWIGLGTCPSPGDGVIFSGVGAISRRSVSGISQWMEWIYKYGEAAYGVGESPSSIHRRRRRVSKGERSHGAEASKKTGSVKHQHSRSRDRSPGIPPPIISAAEGSLHKATKALDSRHSSQSRSLSRDRMKSDDEENTDSSMFGTDAMMKYLTLGYGTAWSLGLPSKPANRRVSALKDTASSREQGAEEVEPKEMQTIDPTPEISEAEEQIVQAPHYTIGRYIIGLQGDLENDVNEEENRPSGGQVGQGFGGLNNRISLRTLVVEMSNPPEANQSGNKDESIASLRLAYKKLQIIVYLHQPFVFTFLFELRTTNLSFPPFYRSIHHQLGPLQKPLLSSTSLSKVQERIYASVQTRSTSSYPSLPIYDLVYDPRNLTVHTSIPNIPEPGAAAGEGSAVGVSWTRMEALNVHTQILSTYISTRNHLSTEIERTCKTSRGWWVVWMKISGGSSNSFDEGSEDNSREAFLVRRASDYVSSTFTKKASGGTSKWLRDISGSSTMSAAGPPTASPGKVAEGMGIDTRKYVEGLLSLNR